MGTSIYTYLYEVLVKKNKNILKKKDFNKTDRKTLFVVNFYYFKGEWKHNTELYCKTTKTTTKDT